MAAFDITQYNKGIPANIIRDELANNSVRIVVDYPMSHINSSNSHLDIIHNYLEASYISEELGKYSASIEVQDIPRHPYSPICRYEIIVKEEEPLIESLRQLSVALYGDQEDDNFLMKHQENLNTYAESLDDRLFLCPNLIDGYYANLVNGAYFDLESELEEVFLADEYEKYPEREYEFWKSAYSKTIGDDSYVSSECWVVPLKIDIQKLISKDSGLSSDETYNDATLFSLDNISYLANQYAVVYFPFSPLLHAKKFVSAVLRKHGSDLEPSENILTYSSIIDDLEDHYGIDWHAKTLPTKYLLSQTSQSIIVEDGSFRYVFFPDQIKGNKIASLYDQLSAVFGFIGEFAGVTKNLDLSWENFDDEKFETLCYDIIYHHPKFDNTAIRKMGKSRSRDGGRDIVAHTKERLGSPRKMYIFQCKFTKASSLGAQRVENISDVIAQYDAQGYGVMSPVIIDSTLYDKIDGVCARHGIESENLSVLEIERFIARHPNLKERHFK